LEETAFPKLCEKKTPIIKVHKILVCSQDESEFKLSSLSGVVIAK
jgi:hypothetical protein